MELRHLECFFMVSTTKSFTKAADILHMSQPSVTKAIQALEGEFNLPLFNRSQKQVELTEAGQVLFIHAKKILQDIEAAQTAMERFQSNKVGVIRFGVPPMVESYLFPNVFIKFQAANPKISIDLQECSDSSAVHENLEKGALDLGIVYLKADETDNRSLKLFDDEFYLCLSKKNKLASAENISFSSLRKEKFILQPSGTFQNFATIQSSANAGFSPEILLCTSQLKAIKELVSSGAAVALLPRFVITPEKNFKALPVIPPIKFTVALAWSKFNELSPICIKFIKFVDALFHADNKLESSRKNFKSEVLF